MFRSENVCRLVLSNAVPLLRATTPFDAMLQGGLARAAARVGFFLPCRRRSELNRACASLADDVFLLPDGSERYPLTRPCCLR